MVEIQKSDMRNKYFRRLLTAFLCISILPLSICVMFILYANYAMNMERYEDQISIASKDCIQKIDRTLKEYQNIISSLNQNKKVKNVLMETYSAPFQNKLESIVKPVMTGREDKIRIQIIDSDSSNIYQGKGSSNLYRTDIYSGFGMLYQLREKKGDVILFPNKDMEDGRSIIFSMGQAITNEEEEILGYTIIDVYKESLLSMLSLEKIEQTRYVLTDKNGIVLLDTTSDLEEGKQYHLENNNTKRSFLKGLFHTKEETFVHYNAGTNYGFSLYSYTEISDFYIGLKLLLNISLLTLCAAVLLCLTMASLLAKKLYRPVGTLVDSMKKIADGDLSLRLEEDEEKNDEMTLVARVFNHMQNQMNQLIDKVVEKTEREKLAEIKALQAQISPHFLYNMLNEIKALAKLNRVSEISEFVICLGRLLRKSITYKDAMIQVREDIEFVKEYLKLQQIRYEQSFSIEIDVAESVMECMIPNLILQPLIENSIIHGFVDSSVSHVLTIKGYRLNGLDKICFEIYDDGVGVDEDYMQYINNVESSSGMYGGLGVENVQKRLMLTYGIEYGIQMESQKGAYTKVKITLPYYKKADQDGGTFI